MGDERCQNQRGIYYPIEIYYQYGLDFKILFNSALVMMEIVVIVKSLGRLRK